MKKWFAFILTLWMTAGIILLNLHMQVSAEFAAGTKVNTSTNGVNLQQYAFNAQDDAIFTGSENFHTAFEVRGDQQIKRNASTDNYLRIVYARDLNHKSFVTQHSTLILKASLLHAEGYYLFHLRKLRI